MSARRAAGSVSWASIMASQTRCRSPPNGCRPCGRRRKCRSVCPERLVHLGGILVAEPAERPVPRKPAERDQLLHGQAVRGRRELRHIGDQAGKRAVGELRQAPAEQAHGARGRRLLAREDLDQRALAGAVRPDQPMDAALRQRQRQRLENHALADAERNGVQVEKRVAVVGHRGIQMRSGTRQRFPNQDAWSPPRPPWFPAPRSVCSFS